jgi:hypothetical protein
VKSKKLLLKVAERAANAFFKNGGGAGIFSNKNDIICVLEIKI